MSIAEWLVSSLALNLPAGFRLEVEKSEEFRRREPWFDVVREDVVRWEGPDDKSFWVFVWTPEPRHPGHPMQAISQREVAINGHQAMLVETSLFEGMPRRSFVIFMSFDAPPVLKQKTPDEPRDGVRELLAESRRRREKNGSKLRIVGEGMVREEFESIFARLEDFSPREPAPGSPGPSASAPALQKGASDDLPLSLPPLD